MSDRSSPANDFPFPSLGEIRRTVRDKLARRCLFVLPTQFTATFATHEPCVVCERVIGAGTQCKIPDGRGGFVFAHFMCHNIWECHSREIREREARANGTRRKTVQAPSEDHQDDPAA